MNGLQPNHFKALLSHPLLRTLAMVALGVAVGGGAAHAQAAGGALQPAITFITSLAPGAKAVLGGALTLWIIYVIFKLFSQTAIGVILAMWTVGSLVGGLVIVAAVTQLFGNLNINIGGGN